MRHYLRTKVVEVIEVSDCQNCPALWVQDMETYLHYRCCEMDLANIRYSLQRANLDTIYPDCPLEYHSQKEIEEMITST